MEHGLKLFYQVFDALLFCVCIALLIIYVNNYDGLLHSLKKVTNEPIVYEQSYEKREVVAYGQIISALSTTLDYSMKVGGVTIDKDQHTYSKMAGYGIEVSNYIKTYEYDESGNIQWIHYNALLDE